MTIFVTSYEPIRIEQVSRAAPERVWRKLTHVDDWPETFGTILKVERKGSWTEFDTNARWLETRRLARRKGKAEVWVAAIDPGRSLTIETDTHDVRYSTTYFLEPEGNDTRLTLEFAATPLRRHGPLDRFMQRLAMKAVRRGLEIDLADLARAAER